MESKSSTIEEFRMRSLKYTLGILVFCCLLGGFQQIIMKLLGKSNISAKWAILYAMLTIFEAGACLYFGKKSIKNGRLENKPYQSVKYVQLFSTITNSICLSIFSAYAGTNDTYYAILGCVLLLVFHLDSKLIKVGSILEVIGIGGVCVFMPSIIPEGPTVGLLIVFLIILNLFVSLVNKTLVVAKDDEIKENADKLQAVIDQVSLLSNDLSDTIMALSASAQEENSHMIEINDESQIVSQKSKQILNGTQKSIENLNQLQENSKVITSKMNETQKTSTYLQEISIKNEKSLNHVLDMSQSVHESTSHTIQVVNELQKEAKEIDQLLNVINEVAEKTNLLALNASIEAARAGETGRGFAVVAEEVRKLADSTKESLNSVNQVVNQFKKDIVRVENLAYENSNLINEQNHVLEGTAHDIKQMIIELKKNVIDILEVSKLNGHQNQYVGETVAFNSEIAITIKDEMNRIEEISSLVQNNMTSIEDIVKSIEQLNKMMQDIKKLLNE